MRVEVVYINNPTSWCFFMCSVRGFEAWWQAGCFQDECVLVGFWQGVLFWYNLLQPKYVSNLYFTSFIWRQRIAYRYGVQRFFTNLFEFVQILRSKYNCKVATFWQLFHTDSVGQHLFDFLSPLFFLIIAGSWYSFPIMAIFIEFLMDMASNGLKETPLQRWNNRCHGKMYLHFYRQTQS